MNGIEFPKHWEIEYPSRGSEFYKGIKRCWIKSKYSKKYLMYQLEGKQYDFDISLYHDKYDEFGSVGQPYYEIYDGDNTERFYDHEVNIMIETISSLIDDKSVERECKLNELDT